MSNFAILRVQKHKSAHSVWGVARHHAREIDCPSATGKKSMNKAWGHSASHAAEEFVKQRLNEIEAKGGMFKIRSNQAVALEYMIAASPEALKDSKKAASYLLKAREWVEKLHGKENVIAAYVHGDETTPHLHVLVVPVAPSGKLSASHFVDGAAKLSDMQTRFHADVGALYAMDRGLKKSGARHMPVREFWAAVGAETPTPTKTDYAKAALGIKTDVVLKQEKKAQLATASAKVSRVSRRRARRTAELEGTEAKAQGLEKGLQALSVREARVSAIEAENKALKAEIAAMRSPGQEVNAQVLRDLMTP